MEYNREYWKPRIATNPNRFRKLNESNDYVELINEPESISQAGTAATAARMNNIEAGIEGVVAEVNEIQGVLDFTTAVASFSGLSQTSRWWHGMTTLGNDVYACVSDGDIYKQTNGTGDFVALGQTTRSWRDMTTLGTDVYACEYNGDIYKQTNGTGDFIALGQESRAWYGMTTLGSDVYACVFGGDIYKQTNGTGDFIALGQNSRPWVGMTKRENDVYASVFGGDIYKQAGGVGDFIALGQASRGWQGMTTLGNDIYACVNGGDIYKQTNGVGDFIALGQASRDWRDMTTLGDDVYACVGDGDIYTATILTGNTYRASSSFTLPAMPDGARKRIMNTNETNAITVTAYTGTTIEGQATMTLSAGHEVELELIGTDWRKVVLSQSATPEAGRVMVWPSVIYNTSNRTLNGGETKVVEIYKQPKIRQVSGVIRYYSDVDGSGNPGWNFIDNHYALGLGLQVSATSSTVNLTWTISDFVNPKVVSFVCTPDESYARMGLFCGASVARDAARISLYAGELGDLITYNSATGLWESWYGNLTAKWVGSELRVSIAEEKMSGSNRIFYNYPFPTIGNRCGAVGTVQVEGNMREGGLYKHKLSFWTHEGTQITSPQAGMRVWVKTGIPRPLNPLTDFSDSYSNIWFNGYVIDADSVGG